MALVPVDNALLESRHMSRLQWVHGGTGVGSLPLLFCVKEAPEFIYINFDKFWDVSLVLIDSDAVEGGAVGPIGPPGIEGEEGDPGLPGPPGVAGVAGAPGAVGVDGAMGPPGIEGEEGDIGLPGPPGVAGVAGAPGAAGADGAVGLIGPPGLEGDEGAPGLPIPGPAGLDGAVGAPGAPGAAGADGVMGPPGVEGEEGDPSLPGPAGIDGVAGAPGAAGVDGASGPPGIEGEEGEFGLPGPPGVAGADGAPGAAGVAGSSGPIGPPGVDGEDSGMVPGPNHPEVTLSTELDTVLQRTDQELDLDTQAAERVFAGPVSGAAAKPAFRLIKQTDVANDWRNFVETLAREDLYHEYEFDISGHWTSAVVGAGASVRYNTQHILDIATGVTASRSVLVRHERFAGWQMGVVRSQIDWDKRFLMNLLLTPCEGVATGGRRITLGKDHNNVIGDPVDKAIGFRFGAPGVGPGYVTAVTGYAHTGVGLNTVALGNVQGFSTHKFLVINNGDTNVDFWIDSVYIGSCVGPAGLGTLNFCIFQMEVDNGATAAWAVLNLHAGRLVWDNS